MSFFFIACSFVNNTVLCYSSCHVKVIHINKAFIIFRQLSFFYRSYASTENFLNPSDVVSTSVKLELFGAPMPIVIERRVPRAIDDEYSGEKPEPENEVIGISSVTISGM